MSLLLWYVRLVPGAFRVVSQWHIYRICNVPTTLSTLLDFGHDNNKHLKSCSHGTQRHSGPQLEGENKKKVTKQSKTPVRVTLKDRDPGQIWCFWRIA